MADKAIEILVASWLVVAQMAPYLLFGFLVAGILSVLISPEKVERHLGGRGFWPVFKAAMFGVPLPLCSCGVIPVSASLSRHGASRGATTAFLISTPQTGVDSIAVTYALLGPVFAVVRPVLALVSGLIGGALADRFDTGGDAAEPSVTDSDTAKSACKNSAACGCGANEWSKRHPLVEIFHYGFITLPGDIGPALLLGVVAAGLITALVPQGALSAYVGGGIISIVVMMAVGVPLYVCSTASVAVAVGFIHMGVSPGAALAFLVAGPATNAATIATVWKVLGRRVAAVYLVTIALSAVAGGLLLDWLLPGAGAAHKMPGAHDHDLAGLSPLDHIWALLLLGVTLPSYFAKYLRSADHGIGEDEAKARGDSQLTIRIKGMHCSHCAEAVCRELLEVEGVDEAEVLLEEKRALVFGRNLDAEKLCAVVRALGYEAEQGKAEG